MRVRYWVFAVLVLAVLAGGLAAVFVVSRQSGVAGATTDADVDLAVVLAPDPARTRLVVVDLGRKSVVRTVPLRSLVTDIDVDERLGRVVAAQTGGIGDEADDAVSLIDPRTGVVRYVTLPVRDPANVVCLDGRAYVLHSVATTEGLIVSIVDIAESRVIATGHVPDGSGLWARAAGTLWATRMQDERGLELVQVDPASLDAKSVPVALPLVTNVTEAGERAVALGGAGRVPDTGGSAAVEPLDRRVAPLGASSLSALRYPATMATVAAGRLVVSDWGGQADEAGRLGVLDALTLEPAPSIQVDGVPCALAAWGSTVLAVERRTGSLLLIDPASGATRAVIQLGTGELPCADIVVLEGASQ